MNHEQAEKLLGALIFDDQSRVFLSKRGHKAKNEVGLWEIPGGAIEFGETIKEGLKREVKEEFDIEVEAGELLQLVDHLIPSEKQHWVSPTYVCKIVRGVPKIMEPDKCEEIGWFSFDEAEKLQLSLVTQQDLKLLREKKYAPNS